jgi:phospholipid/cholesterol/gamma-HCH transport system permease protein
VNTISRTGELTLRFIESLGELAVFQARVFANLLKPPFRFKVLIKELYKLGVLSLSIVCISGLAVGMVLGLQGYHTLSRFGSANMLGAMVGVSLIRELGPVLTGLLVTGRAGSATTAEIGTMVATEQLDGLRMMSIKPVHLVVVPKALAMLLVMPLLTALFNVMGIFGGYLVGVSLMGLDRGAFLNSMDGAILFSDDITISLIKSLVFGLIVGLIATWRGCTSAPTSAGVSAATTSTVVAASVSIIILDYFLTALWGFA